MPRESALNFPKRIQQHYNVLQYIHYFHYPSFKISKVYYSKEHIAYNANTFVLAFSCGVGGYINCPWPPPPTYLTIFAQWIKKSLRKTANMGHTGTSRQLLKNRPSSEGRDPIRGRQHWLLDMTWDKLGSFDHYSLFNIWPLFTFQALTSVQLVVLILWERDVSFSAIRVGFIAY